LQPNPPSPQSKPLAGAVELGPDPAAQARTPQWAAPTRSA